MKNYQWEHMGKKLAVDISQTDKCSDGIFG